MHKENQILNKLISGTLKKDELNKILQNPENNNKEKISFDVDAAWEKVKQKRNLLQKRKKTGNFKFKQIAAIILLITGFSFTALFIYHSNKNTKIYSGNTIKELTLSDGSLITLNKNTSLTYPKNFNLKDRTVSLKGEAFFKIRKNSHKPFFIHTNDVKIKVTGTSFNVKTKGQTEVIVKTGKVELTSKKFPDKKVFLTKGEKGIANSEELKKIRNNNSNYLAWKTHFFTYENEKLKNIVSDLNNVYDTKISFENPEIGEMKIGKTTFDNNSINEIVEIICKTLPLKAIKEKRKIILTKK